jgi:hypothetical protein
VSRGYFPGWDLSLEAGEAQELRVFGVLTDLNNGGTHVEVKSDFYLNERFFIEVQDRRDGRLDYRDTGIRTTRAALIVLNKPSIDALHIYRVADLRELERRGLLGPLRDGGTSGDCPTRGYVVTASMLDAALAFMARGVDPLFDQNGEAL